MIRLRRTRSVTDWDGLQLRSADAGTGGHHSDRMVACDAVTSGFVESLAHPRGTQPGGGSICQLLGLNSPDVTPRSPGHHSLTFGVPACPHAVGSHSQKPPAGSPKAFRRELRRRVESLPAGAARGSNVWRLAACHEACSRGTGSRGDTGRWDCKPQRREMMERTIESHFGNLDAWSGIPL